MNGLVVEIEPLDPVLWDFLLDRHRFSGIMGPLGSGKTYTAILKLLMLMTEQEPNGDGIRPTRVVCIRNTYSDLFTTTIRDFREVFTEKFGTMKLGGIEPPTFSVNFRMQDGTIVRSDVIFLALDREEHVRKLRGVQATFFWLNETKELVKSILDMADLRHGRYPSMAAGHVNPTWHGMIGDTNAPDEDHWYHRLAETEQMPDWKFFRQPGGVIDTGALDKFGKKVWIPNPEAENLANLPDRYYERGLQGKDDAWIANMLGNEYGFVLDGKPVHPGYIDSKHTTTENLEFDKDRPLLLGIDFGRTPAAAIGQRDTWGRITIIDEFVSEDMSQAVFGPELRRYLNANYPGAKIRAWSDPAGEAKGQATEDTPRQVLVASGIPCQPAPSNKVILRRASISNPLQRLCGDGRPAFMVCPKAKWIRKGLMGGFQFRRMKVSGDERFTDEPDKNAYSHPVEATEYLMLGEGEGQMALMPAGYDAGPVQTTAVM